MITMMIAELERAGLDIDNDGDETLLYTYTNKDVSIAKRIAKFYGCKVILYMPGSKPDDKAAEYQIVANEQK